MPTEQPARNVGTWIARNVDATEVYAFPREIDALRFANSQGYELKVLCIPYGQDVRRWTPPPEEPPRPTYRGSPNKEAEG